MLLIIGGHQRSGTTLLRRLCDQHPDMRITMEFGSFVPIDSPYTEDSRRMFRRWQQMQNRPFDSSYAKKSWIRLRNLVFVTRYLSKMRGYWKDNIGLPAIEAALGGIFPESHVVGDKYPDYVYLLDKLKKIDGLRRLIIYRDCRDVTSSTLRMARTKWRNAEFSKAMDTAEKVAKRWVQAIELMEKHADGLWIMRYEKLVEYPRRELKALSNWLGVDPSGFRTRLIRDTSIGKYRSGLTDEELATVMEIAGPTMARLGYERLGAQGGSSERG